jgi:hypothetical protein
MLLPRQSKSHPSGPAEPRLLQHERRPIRDRLQHSEPLNKLIVHGEVASEQDRRSTHGTGDKTPATGDATTVERWQKRPVLSYDEVSSTKLESP